MKSAILGALCGALIIVAAPVAHADPDDDAGSDGPSTTTEICGAFEYGRSPQQIAGGLGRNDARWNYWRAQQRTNQTIIGGDCG